MGPAPPRLRRASLGKSVYIVRFFDEFGKKSFSRSSLVCGNAKWVVKDSTVGIVTPHALHLQKEKLQKPCAPALAAQDTDISRTVGPVGAAVVVYDIYTGNLGIWIALIAIAIGQRGGFITSRIFHLSWDRDAM